MHRDFGKNKLGPDSERILVAGDPFRGYLEMITSAFTRAGVNAVSLRFESPQDNPLTYLQEYLSRDYRRNHYKERSIRNGMTLERAIVRESPDYVLVLNGARLRPSAIAGYRKAGLKLVLWAYDSVRNIPEISVVAGDFDLVYTYEPDDLPLLPDSCSKKYLPMAYDCSLYHPETPLNETPETDICFVGTLDLKYGPRYEMLRRLACGMQDRRITVWAQNTPWYSPFRLKDAQLSLANSNVIVSRESRIHGEINGLYGNSKICLNVHHSQSRRALNPRTFEILGSGRLLLTDRPLTDLPDFREGRDYATYTGVDDLVSKAEALLDDARLRNRIESSGYSVVRSAHTYSSRAETILSDLRKNR